MAAAGVVCAGAWAGSAEEEAEAAGLAVFLRCHACVVWCMEEPPGGIGGLLADDPALYTRDIIIEYQLTAQLMSPVAAD